MDKCSHTVGQLPVTVANTPEFINLKEDEVIQGHRFGASFPIISGSHRVWSCGDVAHHHRSACGRNTLTWWLTGEREGLLSPILFIRMSSMI